MTKPRVPASIEQMIAELEAAGWIARSPTLWVSPNGGLYRGPFGAYIVMSEAATNGHQSEAIN
jgi:hypothetical protein